MVSTGRRFAGSAVLSAGALAATSFVAPSASQPGVAEQQLRGQQPAGAVSRSVPSSVVGARNAGRQSSKTARNAFDPSTEIGAMAPLGFFDPAGFSKKGDEDGFRTLRAAEIKHGRVAMMAALGAVVQHYVKFPGFDSVPSGIAASITAPGSYGLVALFAVAGILELGAWTESPEKEPGNFGDPAGLGQYTQEFREREINNGRFAMFAAIGIIAAELYTGKDAIEQFGL